MSEQPAEASRDNAFLEELRALINRHSIENHSNTPDHILAVYLENCLSAYEEATRERDAWYGIAPRPGWEGNRVMVYGIDVNEWDRFTRKLEEVHDKLMRPEGGKG